jgi:hypothetical protein
MERTYSTGNLPTYVARIYAAASVFLGRQNIPTGKVIFDISEIPAN